MEGLRNNDNGSRSGATMDVGFEAAPERRLIRPHGGHRHIDFRIQIGRLPEEITRERMPLTLAMVIDRSGSMSGDKIVTAKRAALAVLDRLEERDSVAVVVFDDKIDVLQSAARATADVKDRVRRSLSKIEARASTALHEGWLTGCKAIAGESASLDGRGLARCFLLTDGLANVGVTDPEQIASEAGGIRAHAGVATSTFGIGADYDEKLLAPMAVAGGGQFHHLRTANEIASTFLGELGDLCAVVASRVCLELEVAPGIRPEVVSAYWSTASAADPQSSTFHVGDLLSGEERHIVVRFGFPARDGRETLAIRARVTWLSDGSTYSTAWQQVQFVYADNRACDVELRDRRVTRWIGLHHAEKAKAEAAELNGKGDLEGARRRLQGVIDRIAEYAGSDPDLLAAISELEALKNELSEQPMATLALKEIRYQTQRKSRAQRDFRG